MSKGGQKTKTTSTADRGSQDYINQMRQQAQQGSNVALAGPADTRGQGMPGYGTQFGPGWHDGTPEGKAAYEAAGSPQVGGSWFEGEQKQSIGDQVSPFMNPYIDKVVGAVNTQFDHLRSGARNDTKQQATLAGAYGGTRHGVAEGVRMSALDRTQMGILGDLYKGGYDNALTQGVDYAEQQRLRREQVRQEPIWKQEQAQRMLNFGMGSTGTNTTTIAPGPSAFGQAVGAAQAGMGLYGQYKDLRGGGSGQPTGYQSAPQFTMPQPWEAPAWNGGYKNPYSR